MERVKIAFIGAGSAVWSSKIITDLLIRNELRNLDIWLMDIDDDRLRTIYSFAKRYVKELNRSDLGIFKTKDRRDAIREADFIINSVMAGGHQYYERMRDVSERYGYYRGINSIEWNQVSDYHTIWGYYQLKLVMEIVHDVEELAPDALLLNVANPVFELTTLATRRSKVRFVGLCHGHLEFLKAVEVLGIMLAEEKLNQRINKLCAAHDPRYINMIAKVLDFSSLDVEMSGFNHVIWLTKFKYYGEDAYKYVDEWVKKYAKEYWDVWKEYVTDPFNIGLSLAAADMYKRFGVLPIGDTVRGGTWKYHWDLKTKQYWYGPYGGPDSEIGWAMYLAYLKRELNAIKKAVMDETTPLTQRYPPKPSGESIVEIIDAIVNDVPKKHYYLEIPFTQGVIKIPVPIQINIPNQGVLPRIPDDVAVEIPVKVDGKGIHKESLISLPNRVVNQVIYPRMMRMEWALQAFLEGGRDHLFNWLIYDVRTKSIKQAEDVIDAILNLPENEGMKKHFS